MPDGGGTAEAVQLNGVLSAMKKAALNGVAATNGVANGHPSSPTFLEADDLDAFVQRLTVTERIALLSGADFWHTAAIPRLGVPAIKVSDGPNGARGGSFLTPTPALCLPCGTAMGATFNPDLLREVGQLLAREVKARAALVCLGPTVNIQRSPLNGRAFESYCEDSWMAGELAAELITGLQESGVAGSLKHFVANDMEHDRNGVDVRVSERALREVYLLPYQIAQRSKPWSMMTSYNSVNGTHVSENRDILQKIVRDEWSFDGLFMSDWFGTYSSKEAIDAGLDLEMPGPTRWRTHTLIGHLLGARKLTQATIDERAKTVLCLIQRVARASPETISGSKEERTLKDSASEALARKTATQAIVLLKNDRDVLPIRPPHDRSVAIMGPNAMGDAYSGGGSAALRPYYLYRPYDGIALATSSHTSLQYTLGTWAHLGLPLLGPQATTTSGSNQPGCTITFWDADEEGNAIGSPIHEVDLHKTEGKLFGTLPGNVKLPFFAEVTCTFVSETTGDYEFGVTVAGRARLFLDERQVVDNWSTQRKGTSFFGCGTKEERGCTQVVKGQQYRLRVDFSSVPSASISDGVFFGRGVRFGGFACLDGDEELAKAVKMASEVDTPVVVVGLNSEWESEGFDRPTLALPLRTNELVSAVARANPRTVVVVQTGSAVSMPWIDEVSAVVWAPYGGNETGRAIGDVLFGHSAPSGRLSVTFPRRDQDVPAYLNFRSQEGVVEYNEGLFVGYKWYNALKIDPLFAFGHGLSYAAFEYSSLSISTAGTSAADFNAVVTVNVTNTGVVRSSHSVLLFLAPPPTTEMGLVHPEWTLRGTKMVEDVEPGQSVVVTITFDKYGVSHWNPRLGAAGRWAAEQGVWSAHISESARRVDSACEASFLISSAMEWDGI